MHYITMEKYTLPSTIISTSRIVGKRVISICYLRGRGGTIPFKTQTITWSEAVYAFYSWSLLTERGVPLVQKAHITELQMFQFLGLLTPWKCKNPQIKQTRRSNAMVCVEMFIVHLEIYVYIYRVYTSDNLKLLQFIHVKEKAEA